MRDRAGEFSATERSELAEQLETTAAGAVKIIRDVSDQRLGEKLGMEKRGYHGDGGDRHEDRRRFATKQPKRASRKTEERKP